MSKICWICEDVFPDSYEFEEHFNQEMCLKCFGGDDEEYVTIPEVFKEEIEEDLKMLNDSLFSMDMIDRQTKSDKEVIKNIEKSKAILENKIKELNGK